MSGLDTEVLRKRLVEPDGPYARLELVESTGSTNADLVVAAKQGAADRTVLIAREQTAGRGRRAREWVSPAGGLYLSVLLRPDGVPVARLGWLALIAGVALADTARLLGCNARVKWPNDLLIGDAKCAGVLAEVVDGGVVLGIGLNVAPLASPVPAGTGGLAATSLAEHGATSDRGEVAALLLAELDSWERAWRAAGGDPLRSGVADAYAARSATLGRRVRVELSGGATIVGTAEGLDTDGQLLVRTDDGFTPVSAGDVVHLRAEDN